jgi:hypothetical protein
VATLGITREQAKGIKTVYQEIRDRILREETQVTKVNLIIEPLDQVAIGAWAAKDHGILRLAKSSFHFELPAQHLFYRESARWAYTKILVELTQSITTMHNESKVAAVTPVVHQRQIEMPNAGIIFCQCSKCLATG